ncbi:RNA-directed DNA polymerase, eukaryota, partial [Tanacetum coccineum]
MGIDDWHEVSRKKHGYRSYEDDVAKISISIYVSNLPETFSAKDLFHACNKYGHVVDSFIPLKRSKEGKRFGFVKFINVSNVERLVGNLCTVWVGRYKLQANKARFGRPPLNGRNIRNSKSDDRHLGGFKEPNVRPTNGNKETRNNSFASVLKSNQPNNLSSSNMIHDASPAIALDDDCLSAWKVYWIRIRELEPWSPELDDEFCESSSDDEFVGDEKNNSITGDANDHVSESSFMNENIENVINEQEPPQDKISEDPFGIYNILNKQDNKEAGQDSDPSHPPGFTQEVNVGVSVNQPVHSDISPNIGGSQNVSGVNRSFSLKTGGSIMDVIENLVEVGQTMGYNMAGCKKNLEDIVASHGDSMLESINLFSIKDLWGNSFFDFSFSSSVGLSGGILCVWDPNSFVKDNATISDYFVAVRGTWLSTATKVMFVSIYAPQDISEKKSLWEYITHIIDTWDGECIILGDFNEVRSKQERFGTIFNETAANAFNHFISTAGLIDLPLEGYSFTWAIKSAKKMSKLDRFLISEGLLLKFPSLSAICLDRHLSDHRPIIMREVVTDYGPSPFRVYQSWFHKKGFDKLIKDSWSYSSSNDSNKIILLKKKLQALKASIKEWCKDDIKRSNDTCFSIKARLSDLDKLFDNGLSNEELVTERISLLKELHNFNKSHSLDLAQKAKVRWAIEGDENSKYFHGIINKKRSQLAIRGVLIDGDWIDEPCKVKNEFLMHFANRFESPSGPCIDIDCHLFKKLSSEQVDDLECDVTFDEIKKAVWDCGTNKSPGPDGFSFDFIRTFWDILKHDFVNAIREFFISSKFPPGCNSSFIALIPKKHDAKFVKDYRPISLIGCFYKIVSKILANRLKMVISELISDVQSAFQMKLWTTIGRAQNRVNSLNVRDVKPIYSENLGRLLLKLGEHKGKEIAKPITPPSESVSVSDEDSDPEQAQRDKEMQKNLALLAKNKTEEHTKVMYPIGQSVKAVWESKDNDRCSPLQAEQADWVVEHMKRFAFEKELKNITATWQRFRRSHLKNPVLLKDDSKSLPDSYIIYVGKRMIFKAIKRSKRHSLTQEIGKVQRTNTWMKTNSALGIEAMTLTGVSLSVGTMVKEVRKTDVEENPFVRTKPNIAKNVCLIYLFLIRVNHTTSVSRPQLKCYQAKDKVVPNNSQVKFKTSNENAVCAECGICVFNSNHDACVSRYLNDVNARTKKPNIVPISVSKPKRKANKSVATPHKKTVASDTTIQKSKSYYK